MSDLLNVGSSAVSAYRAALSAIADNVANAETPGYARRQVVLEEAANAGQGGIGMGSSMKFSGVKAAAVERAWDAFLAQDARLSASAHGRASAREQWLTTVEGALGQGDRTVGALITGLFNAGVALAANPGDTLGRSAMLSALEEAAGSIRSTAAALAEVSSGIKTAAQLDVDALNADLRALSDMNLLIRKSEPGRSSYAGMEDERDRLIDSIAKRIDINVAIGNDGTATLTLARAAGVTLLDPTSRALVIVEPALDGRLSLLLSANGTKTPLPATGGTLAGLVDVAASTADKRAELEDIASDFMTELNNWSAAGTDVNGNPGGPLLTMTGGAITLQVAITDPDAIAAASATAENGNLLDLSSLRGANGAESRWAGLVALSSQALAAARSEASATATRRDNSFAARDEVSGIDLDHEAAELMRYQQAYGASAKIIQVARETMQAIFDIF
jgi:flagellar hook-associated protein 1 FlgK